MSNIASQAASGQSNLHTICKPLLAALHFFFLCQKLQRPEFFLGRLLGLPYQPKHSTSQKSDEKAKNVLAIKILYQKLKKSTFQLQRPEFFLGRLLGLPYQPKRRFFFFAYRVVMVEELFDYIFGIYKRFGYKDPSILATSNSVSVATQAE